MNYTQLSLEQAPSISTPLRFFITAPLFAIAAAILLLFNGPDLLLSRWLPNTLALTHLLTLGFISMCMLGAIFQLLPVLAGAGLKRAAAVSSVVHFLYSIGIIFLTAGLADSQSQLIQISFAFLIPGLFIFLSTVSYCLIKAKSSHAAVQGMRLSVLSLWLAIGLGLLLASGHAWENIPLMRHFTGLHIAWAGVGWISLMIIGVAYQVIPMFQVTSDYPPVMSRYLTPLIFLCLVSWSIAHLFTDTLGQHYTWIKSLIFVMIALLILIFIIVTIQLQLERKKRLVDATLYFWITGLLSLAGCMLIFLYSQFTHRDLSLLIATVFLSGFAISIINGMLYKIVPFLIWLHLHRQLAFSKGGIAGIPTTTEVISHRKSFRQFYLHLIALAFTVMALILPSVFFYPAAIAWLINWCLLLVHLLQAVWLYRTCLASN